jgi:hypothetical protein
MKILAEQVRPDLLQGFLFGSALTASGIGTMSATSWSFAGRFRIAGSAASV